MVIIIDGEEFFTKNEIGKRLERFVEKTSNELKAELNKKREKKNISINSNYSYV